jgi:hypothetical protein
MRREIPGLCGKAAQKRPVSIIPHSRCENEVQEVGNLQSPVAAEEQGPVPLRL